MSITLEGLEALLEFAVNFFIFFLQKSNSIKQQIPTLVYLI